MLRASRDSGFSDGILGRKQLCALISMSVDLLDGNLQEMKVSMGMSLLGKSFFIQESGISYNELRYAVRFGGGFFGVILSSSNPKGTVEIFGFARDINDVCHFLVWALRLC